MYDKYFHSKVIDKALLTDSHTSLDWDSYIMRIIKIYSKSICPASGAHQDESGVKHYPGRSAQA